MVTRAAVLTALLAANSLMPLPAAVAQDASEETSTRSPLRGSIVEDRAARKLLAAGDSRYESDETSKAIEIWQSVIERYPRSRIRYEAHLRLGNFYLERDRAYDRARVHFQVVADEENRSEDQRAEATLKMGVCFYEARNFGKCFQVMRDVIEKFPVSPQVNEAYYYIGLGHFQLGHYSRAIAALEKVGTTLAGENGGVEKVEAGKRLFVKIEDADLAALELGEAVKVICTSSSGDHETVSCFPVGRNVRVVLGSLPTQLGKPVPGNGYLEVRGDDEVTITYTDEHTADRKFDQEVSRAITVVGDAVVAVTDGAFSETLQGVVLGKSINVQIADADRDMTDQADRIKAVVELYRQKTDSEIEEELAKAVLEAESNGSPLEEGDEPPKIDRYRKIDSVEIELVETIVNRKLESISEEPGPAADGSDQAADGDPAAQSESAGQETADAADDGSIHTGLFRASLPLAKADEVIEGDGILQGRSGDKVRVVYIDERFSGEGVRTVRAEAQCVEGNLGGVRVTRAVITDQELRIRTQLKTADALTNIGNRYKEFGLQSQAKGKYRQALQVCEEVMRDARLLGGSLLEQTYVQLWQVYYEMDELNLAAAMAQRLQREFPNSGFVDDALLQLADVARKQKDLRRAIGIYTRLVSMQTSLLRGEAQFGVAQCYEEMAEAATDTAAVQLRDRAFQEYKKVYDNFPDSGRVGEAVAKMANFYYQQKDYARAVDTFETVLSEYPDAKFLDVILFNYGRCLYRMSRRSEAKQKFDQLIGEFPESPLAGDAKKIADALARAGA